MEVDPQDLKNGQEVEVAKVLGVVSCFQEYGYEQSGQGIGENFRTYLGAFSQKRDSGKRYHCRVRKGYEAKRYTGKEPKGKERQGDKEKMEEGDSTNFYTQRKKCSTPPMMVDDGKIFFSVRVTVDFRNFPFFQKDLSVFYMPPQVGRHHVDRMSKKK